MFEPTIPFGEPELMRVSTFRRYLDELDKDAATSSSSRLASLSPSLMADVMRFEQDGNASEAVEVLAACVRHARNVTVHVALADKVVPLTVFPQERLVHCPVEMSILLESRLTELRVMHIEPATLRPPGDSEAALVGAPESHFPLGQLLWELALRGARDRLLPEIAGTAAYRLSPGSISAPCTSPARCWRRSSGWRGTRPPCARCPTGPASIASAPRGCSTRCTCSPG